MGDVRWQREETGKGVVVVAVYRVCYLARELHSFPSQPLLLHPLSTESAMHSAGKFVSTRR